MKCVPPREIERDAMVRCSPFEKSEGMKIFIKGTTTVIQMVASLIHEFTCLRCWMLDAGSRHVRVVRACVREYGRENNCAMLRQCARIH